MYLSKVSIVNYRNFSNVKFLLSKGINTIIGENGSGKTNFFRAIRLLLDDSMRRSAIRLVENDFFRGLGNWRGHWIIISLEFNDVSQDEAIQALFLHGAGNIDAENQIVERSTYNLIFRPNSTIRTELSQIQLGDVASLEALREKISIDDYETVITGKSSADFNSPGIYTTLVGNFETVDFPSELNPSEIGCRVPPILSMSKEVSFTFVQALRDVVSEFHNNRTNPLLNLLKLKSSEINQAEFDPIVAQVNALNSAIETLSDVDEVRKDINKTVNDTVGDAFSPKSLSIKSNLSDEAEQIFQSLNLFIAESDDGHEGAIHEMSLGGANLIYLTLKLLEFKYQARNQPIANFLLIEEPEAHIHTHIQKSLFDRINYPNTQVIYSTHSSHISEASNINNVNVLGKVNGRHEVFQPAYGLTTTQAGSVQRYLDAVRSNLLFAKSVVLVEGDAEEILIPTLIKQVLGVSLDELGISLVNIRSTGFENVALLFHNDRIRKRCGIITDLDARYFDTTEFPGDADSVIRAKKKAVASEASGATRKLALDQFCNLNPWITTFYAPHTFEVDLISSGNSDLYVSALQDVYSDAATIQTSKVELTSTDKSVFGKRALTMANNVGKGWFAITLGKYVTHNTSIPEYILDAIVFAHSSFGKNVISEILKYRIEKIEMDLESNRSYVASVEGEKPEWYEKWNNYINSRQASLPVLKDQFQNYKNDSTTFDVLKNHFITNYPDNKINALLSRL